MAGACAASGIGAPASSSCATPSGLAHLEGRGRVPYPSWKAFTDRNHLCVAPGAEHARRSQEISCHPGGCVLLPFGLPGRVLECVGPHHCQPTSFLPHRLLGAHSHQTPAQRCWSHRKALARKPPARKTAGTRADTCSSDARRRPPGPRADCRRRQCLPAELPGCADLQACCPAGLARSTLPDRRMRAAQHARPSLSSPWRP